MGFRVRCQTGFNCRNKRVPIVWCRQSLPKIPHTDQYSEFKPRKSYSIKLCRNYDMIAIIFLWIPLYTLLPRGYVCTQLALKERQKKPVDGPYCQLHDGWLSEPMVDDWSQWWVFGVDDGWLESVMDDWSRWWTGDLNTPGRPLLMVVTIFDSSRLIPNKYWP